MVAYAPDMAIPSQSETGWNANDRFAPEAVIPNRESATSPLFA